jgi:hypothetical protein
MHSSLTFCQKSKGFNKNFIAAIVSLPDYVEHLFYYPLYLFVNTVHLRVCYSGWQGLFKDEKKDEGNEWV